MDQELLREFNRLGFITRSPSMGPLLRRAHKTAEVSDITVLIRERLERESSPWPKASISWTRSGIHFHL
jgi:hypothetical protein